MIKNPVLYYLLVGVVSVALVLYALWLRAGRGIG
jgi:hypothetical protein